MGGRLRTRLRSGEHTRPLVRTHSEIWGLWRRGQTVAEINVWTKRLRDRSSLQKGWHAPGLPPRASGTS